MYLMCMRALSITRVMLLFLAQTPGDVQPSGHGGVSESTEQPQDDEHRAGAACACDVMAFYSAHVDVWGFKDFGCHELPYLSYLHTH